MYNVGQILYTIIEDSHRVIPVKVVEQVITKTLEGEKTNYTVELPNIKNQRISLSKFKKVFINLDDLKLHLMQNAENAINKMVTSSKDLEKKFFITNKENVFVKNEESLNSVKIDLGNGQIGNVKLNNEVSLNLENKDQKKT